MSQSLIRSRLQRGRVYLVLFVILAVFAALRGPAVGAVGGLSIGPFLQEVTLADGQTKSSFMITVTNTTAVELPLRLTVVDFGAADESGAVNFLPSADNLERRYGLASWMQLEKDVLVLKPGTSQQVKVTVTNRTDLSPGGHYGAVVFRLDKVSGAGEIQPKVNFTKAVSTLVLAKKLGGEKRSVTLSSTTWSGPPFFLPSDVKLRFLNNGNIHTVPTGDVTVTDSFGRVLSTGSLNSASTIILPESIRAYKTKLHEQGTLWLPGWVTVTTRYRIVESGPFVTSSSSVFIATPRSVLVVAVILAVGFAIVRYRHHGARHAHELAKQSHAVVKKVHVATKKTGKRIVASRAKKRTAKSAKHKR